MIPAELRRDPCHKVAVPRRKVRLCRGPLVGRTRRQSGLQRPVVGPAEGGVALRVRLRLPSREEARQRPPGAELRQGAGRRGGAPPRAALRLLAVARARRGGGRGGPTAGHGGPPHDGHAHHEEREGEGQLRPTHELAASSSERSVRGPTTPSGSRPCEACQSSTADGPKPTRARSARANRRASRATP